jgi:hypothetical protein
MRKMALILAICVTILPMTAGIALPAAQKVELIACPQNYPESPFPPGTVFVIFNNPDEGEYNLSVGVSLKKVEPNTPYDIHLFADGSYFMFLGTVLTNTKGNASLHTSGLIGKEGHILAIDITESESPYDVYETPGLHEGQGSYLIFY